MNIKYHSEARKEFFEAAEYYEKQVVGLGDEFIHEVEKVLDVIEQYPSVETNITSNEKRFLVSRFPYGIIYTVEDELIKIFTSMNLRRKSGYWKRRI